MNTRALSVIAATLLLPVAAFAQKDRIVLVDGTVIDRVQVTSYTVAKVEFRRGGSQDSRSADSVASLTVQKVKDVYKRSYASKDPGIFQTEAEEQSDAFLKQFGYYEAARLFLGNEQYVDAFSFLEALRKQVPDSGFVPFTYTAKIEVYLSQGKAKAGDALSVARDYERVSQVQGFPKGFALEARYYKLLAEALGGEIPSGRFREQLDALVRESAGHPNVINRARLQIANSLRAENQLPDALDIYQGLLDKDYVSENVRAGAYLGRGHVQFAEGTASDTEPYREALLSFLRVYLETPDASPGLIAEALALGAQAAEKWGGEDASRMARRLRYVLQRDYPESPWASR